MCLDCGCRQPSKRHDDERHITYPDLKAAAEAEGQSIQKALDTLLETAQEVLDGDLSPTAHLRRQWRQAVVAGVVDELSPLDYEQHLTKRIAIHEPGFTSTHKYFPDDTVAFLDYTPRPDEIRISYIHVAKERRGHGLAWQLILDLVSRDPSGVYEWGKVMEPEIGHLIDKVRQQFPSSQHYVKRYY